MRDAKWISYFRQALLATIALPACGGTINQNTGSSNGEGGATGATPPLADDAAPERSPAEAAYYPPIFVTVQDATTPPAGSPPCTYTQRLLDGGAPDDNGCTWVRDFTGDPLTCAGFVGAGGRAQCAGVCGTSIASQMADTCAVQGNPSGAGGFVRCIGLGGGLQSNQGSCVNGVWVPSIPPGNGGRRPGYFASLGFGQPPAGREIGTHFARVACMEAGSVEAFRCLRDELLAHRAPRRLVRASTRALRDERRHVRQTSALARRYGEKPIAPFPPPRRATRTLLAMALENAVEGCIRETYSALECAWQAHVATDPVVRATMKRIARDELRHLALSWAVNGWALGRLDAEGRRRVRDAQRETIAILKSELARDPHESLLSRAGLPRAFQSQALVESIEAKIAA